MLHCTALFWDFSFRDNVTVRWAKALLGSVSLSRWYSAALCLLNTHSTQQGSVVLHCSCSAHHEYCDMLFSIGASKFSCTGIRGTLCWPKSSRRYCASVTGACDRNTGRQGVPFHSLRCNLFGSWCSGAVKLWLMPSR